MLTTIKNILNQIIDNIDSGNSNINEEDEAHIIDCLRKYTHKDEGMSKYSACQYLNVSRAKFDNMVREGRLPQGKKVVGFKEKRWYKKDLDGVIKK